MVIIVVHLQLQNNPINTEGIISINDGYRIIHGEVISPEKVIHVC